MPHVMSPVLSEKKKTMFVGPGTERSWMTDSVRQGQAVKAIADELDQAKRKADAFVETTNQKKNLVHEEVTEDRLRSLFGPAEDGGAGGTDLFT